MRVVALPPSYFLAATWEPSLPPCVTYADDAFGAVALGPWGFACAPFPTKAWGRGVGAPVCDPPQSPLAPRLVPLYASSSSLPSLSPARVCLYALCFSSSPTEIKVDVVVTIVCDPDWLVYGARPLPTGEGCQSDARSMAPS